MSRNQNSKLVIALGLFLAGVRFVLTSLRHAVALVLIVLAVPVLLKFPAHLLQLKASMYSSIKLFGVEIGLKQHLLIGLLLLLLYCVFFRKRRLSSALFIAFLPIMIFVELTYFNIQWQLSFFNNALYLNMLLGIQNLFFVWGVAYGFEQLFNDYLVSKGKLRGNNRHYKLSLRIEEELDMMPYFLYTLVFVSGLVLFLLPTAQQKKPLFIGDSTVQQQIEENVETLQLLRYTNFCEIDPALRRELLMTLIKIEMANLDIDSLNFAIGPTVENGDSFYSSQFDAVIIDENYVGKDIIDVAATISKVCYRAYQYRRVDDMRHYQVKDDLLLLFKQLKNWSETNDLLLSGLFKKSVLYGSVRRSPYDYMMRYYQAVRRQYYRELALDFWSEAQLVERPEVSLDNDDSMPLPHRLTLQTTSSGYQLYYGLNDELTRPGGDLQLQLIMQCDARGVFGDYYDDKRVSDPVKIEDNIVQFALDDLDEGVYEVYLAYCRSNSGRVFRRECIALLKCQNGQLTTCLNPHIMAHNLKNDSNFNSVAVKFNNSVPRRIAELSREITRGVQTDLAKARALYDWLCNNTVYSAETAIHSNTMLVNKLFKDEKMQFNSLELAKVYHLMLNANDIPSRVMVGNRTKWLKLYELELMEGDRVIRNHSWNQVYIRELERWVYVDVSAANQYANEELLPIGGWRPMYYCFAMPLEVLSNKYITSGTLPSYDNAITGEKK